MNVSKISKDKKISSTSMAKHKADMNITKRLSSAFTKEHLTECTNYILVNQAINIYKSNKSQNSSQKKV